MFWSEYAQRSRASGSMNLRGADGMVRPDGEELLASTAGSPTSSRAGRARSGAAPRRCSATSSASACSACPRSRRTASRRERDGICDGSGRDRHGAGRGIGRGPRARARAAGRAGRRQRPRRIGRRHGRRRRARAAGRRRDPRRRRRGGRQHATTSPTGGRAAAGRRPRSRRSATLDVVVNNAGILRDRMLFNMDRGGVGRGDPRAPQGHVRADALGRGVLADRAQGRAAGRRAR